MTSSDQNKNGGAGEKLTLLRVLKVHGSEDIHSFVEGRLFIWEILHSTIRKMNKHVQKIQKELEEAKDKLEEQQHKRTRRAEVKVALPWATVF
ncbi:nuclear cap-binding protein subunit 1-like [Gouania willdenowi]|uniref:nuclear cap-binding protein subunit 1-like n=1 Tax=Gouania willdenowi TaxID=441366 RepID=UPI0010564D23|nr:nuclear cap-binding protein subunit 1-like [Gouania willdenowi]